MRISLMTTCLVDVMAPDVARATVTLLERLGHEVVFDRRQTCCGQMHTNSGYYTEAAPVVRSFVDTFEASLKEVDAIVMPSGSCAGCVRDQHRLVARHQGDGELEERAAAVSAKTYELSELLVDVLRVTDVGAYFPHSVTYHPTCHSMRFLKVGARPLKLLRSVEGHRGEEPPGVGHLLRLRRHLLREERCDQRCDGHRQGRERGAQRRRVRGRGRRVVPDEHPAASCAAPTPRRGPSILAQILASTREDPFVPSETILGRSA